MSTDAYLTLAVLIGAVVLFVTQKLSVDLVAMLVLASLLLLGLVTPSEALSGFSSEATITVAAMFVLSAGLAQTGALRPLARLFARIQQPTLLLLVLMAVVGPISAFINNTAAVAVFLPLVLAANAARKQASSQFLIPMSYAAQMGGVCTLVGTSTNLLVNSLAQDLGHPGFGLFDFAPLGVITMGIGFLYILAVRRWLLPHHAAASQADSAQSRGKFVAELRVLESSSLIGQSVADAQLTAAHSVYVLELWREGSKHPAPRAEPLREGDVLLVRGDWPNLEALRQSHGLEFEREFQNQFRAVSGEVPGESKMLVEAMVAPGAHLDGQSLTELRFEWTNHATVLALHRRGAVLREQIKEVPLRLGDVLLLLVAPGELELVRRNRNLIVLSELGPSKLPYWRMVLAVAILVAAILATTVGGLPIVASTILGCIALVATRCLGNDEAYQAIDWRVIMLLAGVLPLGIALQKSGLAQAVADFTMQHASGFGPLGVLAAVYILTATLTEVMSNNATAVLITPIAYTTAQAMGVSPTPFLVAVLFAASTSFSTPVGYQTNTMVFNAGNYRFSDFVKIGVPLNLVFWAVAVYFIPRFFPF
jgi:di/tricarboxylate transporter